jgi:hypothetical protein
LNEKLREHVKRSRAYATEAQMGKPQRKENQSLALKIRINVDEAYEIKHWAKRLRVSELQLIGAVAQVGPLVDNVRASLLGQRAENA